MRAQRQLLVVIVLALVGSALGPPSASAAVGDLTPLGCIEWTGAGNDDCTRTADGIVRPEKVAASPDGTSVYVVGGGGAGTITHFSRDPATGDVTEVGCIDDNDDLPGECPVSTDGLAVAKDVAVSPDGRSVYVAARSNDAIVSFARNLSTGTLTPTGCIDDNDSGPDTCASSVDGLTGANSVVISPDGKSVYVAAGQDDSVTWFKRNKSTGALKHKGCIDDNDTGADECSKSTDGLQGAADLAISADGRSVYVSGFSDAAIVALKRSKKTGAIKPVTCVDDVAFGDDDCPTSVDALGGTNGLALSDDGRSLYALGLFADAIVMFDRASNGALTSAGCIADNDTGPAVCAQSTDGLDRPSFGDVSSDGMSFYVATSNDDALVAFDRDVVTGGLTPSGCIDDNDTGPDVCAQSVDGMRFTVSALVSPDGSSVFVTGSDDNALVTFAREV